MNINYNQAAELYLGSSRLAALAQGARRFSTAAKAIRFALEEAAPVSLNGASLTIGAREFSVADLRRLYGQMDYPLARKAA